MEIIKDYCFNNIPIDIYLDENNNIFMTRNQINDALEYTDPKAVNKIILRHSDVIGYGLPIEIKQIEGGIEKKRIIELFNFEQIFQILRFSKSLKANEFMDFSALTMKQIITKKAELKFYKKEDELAYDEEIKQLKKVGKAYGLTALESSILIQQAKYNNLNLDELLLERLNQKQDLSIKKKRGRIIERVNYVSKTFFNGDYARVWLEITELLKYEGGVNMHAIINSYKKQYDLEKNIKKQADRLKLKDIPTTLDLIEKYDLFKEAEKVINKLIKEINKDAV